MRRKKKEALAIHSFWSNFFYFNIPKHLDEIPSHVERVNFRYYGASDEDLLLMLEKVKSIYQLDLDETDITNEGIEHLTRLDYVTEIRLKGCRQINNEAMNSICQLKGLELLHLVGTGIDTDGFEKISHLKNLKRLLISAERSDPKLEEIYISLAQNCEFIVNYKAYPFIDDH
jgi:hypothetical protein